MRRISWALVLAGLVAGLLAGCGDDDGGDRDTGTASDPPAQAAEPALVQTVALTAVGGRVDPTAYFTDEPEQMAAYVRTFDDREQVEAALQQAVEDASEREGRLAVATVALGCDVPEDVSITADGDDVRVVAGKIANPKQECFAPMTTIALVEVPGGPQ